MRAAYYTRRGPARDVLTIGELPNPEPGPGEVRVRLATSGVNPSDWKSRSGTTTNAPLPGPVIPHSDGAGVIDAVGAGVPRARVGERVWIWNGQWQRPFGTAAQYIALPSAQAMPLPAHVGFAEAACLGIPALTALQAVRLARIDEEASVLIHGGAGAVAQYAIQFARLRGARVISTVSSDGKAERARAAGAHATVNYRAEQLAERIADFTSGRGVDAVIDLNFSANAASLPGVVRPHGRVVVYGTNDAEAVIPALWLMRCSVSILPFLVYELSAEDRRAVLSELGSALEVQSITHSVARVMPLEAIAEAHDLVQEGGVVGNVVLAID
jgi:NADPH:quinone reductase